VIILVWILQQRKMSEYHPVFQICDVSEDISVPIIRENRSQWPCVLRLGIKPPDYWERGYESRWGRGGSVLVFVTCCVGCGIFEGLITRQEELYQVYESVCDIGTSTMRRSKLDFPCCHPVHRLKEDSLNLCTGRPPTESDDTRCCINTIWPPDDEHNSARNM
jgi:hypothetical protein